MSRARRETWLWLLQRGSAAAMLPLLFGHLALTLLSSRSELSTAAILGRTQGNLPLAAFYALFVLFASVHAALGVRAWLAESPAWRGNPLDAAAATLAVLLIFSGGRATWAIYSLPA
jgi:succinate dehydrogenase hydrophobic anchor subunit